MSGWFGQLPSLADAAVTDTRICTSDDDRWAEYKYEITLSNGKKISRWRRWKECRSFTVDLYSTSGVSPLAISPTRALAHLSPRGGQTLTDEFIQHRRESLQEHLDRAVKANPTAVLAFVRDESTTFDVDMTPSTPKAMRSTPPSLMDRTRTVNKSTKASWRATLRTLAAVLILFVVMSVGFLSGVIVQEALHVNGMSIVRGPLPKMPHSLPAVEEVFSGASAAAEMRKALSRRVAPLLITLDHGLASESTYDANLHASHAEHHSVSPSSRRLNLKAVMKVASTLSAGVLIGVLSVDPRIGALRQLCASAAARVGARAWLHAISASRATTVSFFAARHAVVKNTAMWADAAMRATAAGRQTVSNMVLNQLARVVGFF